MFFMTFLFVCFVFQQAGVTSSTGAPGLLVTSSVRWSCRTSRRPSITTTTSPETAHPQPVHPQMDIYGHRKYSGCFLLGGRGDWRNTYVKFLPLMFPQKKKILKVSQNWSKVDLKSSETSTCKFAGKFMEIFKKHWVFFVYLFVYLFFFSSGCGCEATTQFLNVCLGKTKSLCFFFLGKGPRFLRGFVPLTP